MLWVTRSRIRVNRAATGWLVRRFVDPEARFCFVDPAEVARIQVDLGAIGFDAPGATYPHKDAAGISRGFPLVATDDHETLGRSAFLYDALYASLQQRIGQ